MIILREAFMFLIIKKIINNLRVDEWHGIEESIKKTAQIK